MPRDLFAAKPESSGTARNTRLLPLSIAVHALLLGAMVIAPLLATGELPRVAGQRLVAIVTAPPAPRPEPARVTASRQRAQVAQPVRPTHAPPFADPAPPVLTNVPFGPGGLDSVTRGLPGVGIGEPVFGGGGAPAPASSFHAGAPLRIGGDIRAPRKLRHVAPEYPAIARHARVQGTVVIDAIIGEDGRVQQASVRESEPLLDEAALRAVRQWVYTPTRLNGVPVAVIMTVEVHFTLGR